MSTNLVDNKDYLHQLIQLYNKNVPLGVFSVSTAASFLAYFYFYSAPFILVLCWYVVQILIILSRLALFKIYARGQFFTDESYRKAIYFNIILTGLGWTFISIIFLDFSDQKIVLITVMAFSALSAGSMTTTTGFTNLGIIYICLTLVPLLIMDLINNEGIKFELAIGMLIYLGFIVITNFRLSEATSKNISDSIRHFKSEQLTRHVINSSVDPIITVNREAIIIGWNNAAEEILGWSYDEVINLPIQPIIDLHNNNDFYENLESTPSNNSLSRNKILTIRNRFHTELTVELKLRQALSGENSLFTINIHNLTEQIKKDKTIIEAEARARNLLNLVNTGIIELDINGQIRFINDSALIITGYKRGELLGKHFHTKLQYQDINKVKLEWTKSPIYQLLFSGSYKYLDREIFWHKDGHMLYTSISSAPVYEKDKIVASILSFSDISERFHEYQEKERLLQIREASPDLMMTFSLEGTILSINKSSRDTFGITNEILNHGLNLNDIFKKQAILPTLIDVAIPTALNQNFWAGETALDTLYGYKIFVSLFIMKLKDDVAVQYFSLTMTDITDAKNAQKALLTAKNEAEAAARAKADFLAIMSHEIRTPINGVLGMGQLLNDTSLDHEQAEYVSIISSSGNALLTIINDILDFSKFEAGHLLIDPIDFDLERMVPSSENVIIRSASEKGLELILNYSAECPKLVKGDAGRIRQILMNLVGNSLKFTKEGYVIIQVQPLATNSDNSISLEFSVIDTGIGIAEDKQQKLFESFTQADNSTTRKYGGTGLGLSISKQLVELMGGSINIESEPDKGSKFYFTIELPIVEERKNLRQKSLLSKKVLIIDDHSINLHVLRNQLQHFGMDVFIASNYLQGIEILKGSDVLKKSFDLIILDYLMPDIDGAELGKLIINDPEIPDCPLVIYSSSASQGDASKFEDIGFSGYLTKPALSDVLHDTLECVLGEYNSPVSNSGIITKYDVIDSKDNDVLNFDFKGVRVLLAEDNLVNQKVASNLLKKYNLIVKVANNGQEAIDLFKQHEFDVVLMDCQMPVKDGFEATEEINFYQQQNNLSVPIIALTANVMENDKGKCSRAGMQSFVSKPFTTEILLSSIQHAINKMVSGKKLNHISRSLPTINLLDKETLISLKNAMEDDFDELISVFFESSRQLISDLWKALNDQQFTLLKRHAHSLKSSSANLGALNLSSMAESIELQCKDNIKVESTQLNAIEEEYLRVENALKAFSSEK